MLPSILIPRSQAISLKICEEDCGLLKGEFVTSRRNEKNMKICAQNTSTTIYNLFNNKF